jgi:hypothetical protein
MLYLQIIDAQKHIKRPFICINAHSAIYSMHGSAFAGPVEYEAASGMVHRNTLE